MGSPGLAEAFEDFISLPDFYEPDLLEPHDQHGGADSEEGLGQHDLSVVGDVRVGSHLLAEGGRGNQKGASEPNGGLAQSCQMSFERPLLRTRS